MRFFDSNDVRLSLDPFSLLLEDSDDSSSSDLITQQISELGTSAQMFRQKWKELLGQTHKLSAEKQQELLCALAEGQSYPISDPAPTDEEEDISDEDDNSDEVHGKLIPAWAKRENLEGNLRDQKKVDPDAVFPEFAPTCSLPDVFNADNPEWQNRTESSVWDNDDVRKDFH
jgi:hypothetical protein